jgi:hypothetical protein
MVCLQGACSSPSSCTMTCSGCCDAKGDCHPGFVDTQCGGYGAACEDCTKLTPASKCDTTLATPACAADQMQCPAAYGGCPAGPPATFTHQAVCSKEELQNAAAACSGGYLSPSCSGFSGYESTQSAGCFYCLAPFFWDFTQVTGLVACAAPYLDATCAPQAGCYGSCMQSVCPSCATQAAESQCLMTAASGACATYSAGNTCLGTALAGPASMCNPATYQNNYGAWLAAVGAQYCGM